MYTVKVHNEVIPSFISKDITTKYGPLERDFTVENQVKNATANAKILGVANEVVSAGEQVGVDNRKFVVGLIGSAGVSAGDELATDWSGGFVVAGDGENVVAIAQVAGVEWDYIELELVQSYVKNVVRGAIEGTLSDQTDLQGALDAKADA